MSCCFSKQDEQESEILSSFVSHQQAAAERVSTVVHWSKITKTALSKYFLDLTLRTSFHPLCRKELMTELEQDEMEQQTSFRLIQERSNLLEDNSSLSAYCQGLKSKLSLMKSPN